MDCDVEEGRRLPLMMMMMMMPTSTNARYNTTILTDTKRVVTNVACAVPVPVRQSESVELVCRDACWEGV
jgi:hypothetical protein